MKKFHFSLETLLMLRDREEQNARAKLSEANALVANITLKIKNLEESISETYGSWDGQSGRRFSPMDRMGLVGQVANLKQQTAQAQQELAQAQQQRTAAMQSLQETSKKRKVVGNLREKRFQEHLAEEQRLEAIEIEDIFNARRSTI